MAMQWMLQCTTEMCVNVNANMCAQMYVTSTCESENVDMHVHTPMYVQYPDADGGGVSKWQCNGCCNVLPRCV